MSPNSRSARRDRFFMMIQPLRLRAVTGKFAQTTPKRSQPQAFRMRRQRAHQPASAFLLVAGFAGRVRAPQETRGPAPATIGSRKTTFIDFSATVEFLVKAETLRHGLA